MNDEKEIKKADIVYWARVIPSVGIYDVIELKIRTVAEDFFVGIENSTKHAYLFNMDDLNKIIFFKRDNALNLVKESEKSKSRVVSDEKYYEEY